LPKLEEFNLKLHLSSSITPTEEVFLRALIAKLNVPGRFITRFSYSGIGAPFTAEIGRILGAWDSLKVLRLGNWENNNGPYIHNGALYCEACALEIARTPPKELSLSFLRYTRQTRSGRIAMLL
jgi:hypothetical protein